MSHGTDGTRQVPLVSMMSHFHLPCYKLNCQPTFMLELNCAVIVKNLLAYHCFPITLAVSPWKFT